MFWTLIIKLVVVMSINKLNKEFVSMKTFMAVWLFAPHSLLFVLVLPLYWFTKCERSFIQISASKIYIVDTVSPVFIYVTLYMTGFTSWSHLLHLLTVKQTTHCNVSCCLVMKEGWYGFLLYHTFVFFA